VERRPFGSTGLDVSVVGLGAGQVGEADVTEDQAAALLNGALDLGVTLVDTALGYGASEERIGRHLAHRRSEFVLTSKGGSGVPGVEDWTPASVRAGLEQTLRRTRSDRVDVYLLHSCPLEVLQRGDLQETLDDAVRAGEVGVAGYSGDNEALAHAAASGRFGAVECSVNVVDRWNLEHVVGQDPGLGVVREAAHRERAVALRRAADRPLRRALLGAAARAGPRPRRPGLARAGPALQRVRTRRQHGDRGHGLGGPPDERGRGGRPGSAAGRRARRARRGLAAGGRGLAELYLTRPRRRETPTPTRLTAPPMTASGSGTSPSSSQPRAIATGGTA